MNKFFKGSGKFILWFFILLVLFTITRRLLSDEKYKWEIAQNEIGAWWGNVADVGGNAVLSYVCLKQTCSIILAVPLETDIGNEMIGIPLLVSVQSNNPNYNGTMGAKVAGIGQFSSNFNMLALEFDHPGEKVLSESFGISLAIATDTGINTYQFKTVGADATIQEIKRLAAQ